MAEFDVVATGRAVGITVQPLLQALLVEDVSARYIVNPLSG